MKKLTVTKLEVLNSSVDTSNWIGRIGSRSKLMDITSPAKDSIMAPRPESHGYPYTSQRLANR